MLNLFSKQSPWSCAVAAGTFALLFTACGDEVTEVTEVSEVTQVVGMQVVEAGDALPKCTADNEGAMVYSVDSAAAYTCIGKKWTSMKGKDGKDGADGKDGKDGINGTNGTNESSSCTAKALKNGKGYKIVCGGDSVGVVLNGKDGAKGAPGVKGDSGATGNNGLSAYEIAKAGGYTGTEEKWITSLKGDPGVKGDTGVAGTSCSAEEDSDGVKITCTDGKSFTLSNGANGKSFVDGWMVDPRDKQLYRVVTIGDQTWMAENLNYKTENSMCGGGSDENEGDCTKYGRLYTWAAAIDSAKLYKDKSIDCGYEKTCTLPDTVYGVCPPGWHLPDTTEWNKLFTAVGGKSIAGKELKSQSGWIDDIDGTSGNGTDAYGFSAFPAGSTNGVFYDNGFYAHFWSATEYYSESAYNVTLYYYDENACWHSNIKSIAFSVRCLKD